MYEIYNPYLRLTLGFNAFFFADFFFLGAFDFGAAFLPVFFDFFGLAVARRATRFLVARRATRFDLRGAILGE